MDKAELLAKMRAIGDRSDVDPQRDHLDLDDLLLEFIGDPVVKDVFESIEKWYS